MSEFSEQALIFITSSIILVPLFQRLGFGSVLGYLIAGIIVGPFGLKLIHDSETIIHIAELGVVLLLFLIGLEIQPAKLWSMRRQLVGLGGMQVMLCSLVFMVIGWFAGLPPIAALVIGFALSLSSTAFAVQTMIEKNQFNTEFGHASFSILLMQDLTAIPALALIPLLSPAAAQTTISPLNVVLLLSLLFVSRHLVRPIFRMIAQTRSREVFTGFTLFIVLGVAALMQKVGLSAALGTFISGVMLADSEYRHELETNIEPFKSLLMGLFFIAVGMGVNLDLLLADPLTMLLLAIAYLAIKGSVIYLSGSLFKLGHENSKMMALNIAQGGEFAFVILGIVMRLNLSAETLIAKLTAVIVLSMAINPLFVLVNEKLMAVKSKHKKKEYDSIDDESPEVIVAGFGRFGQIFGRVLRAQGIGFVAIDHDANQVELVRRFGSKLYYGDASRKDLLESAGAAKAKYFILAIDDVEQSLATAKVVLANFPNLKVFARARNRGHAFDLMSLGIKNIKREIFDSSVYFVQDFLIDRGVDKQRAHDIMERFKRHDEIMLEEQFKVRDDDKIFISVSKQATAQLEKVLSEDSTKSYISR